MTNFESSSSLHTRKFAESLAKDILARGPARLASESVGGRPKARGATFIALHGELGAGKTTFTQGFMKGLDVRARVTSPTFILMRRTKLKGKKFSDVFHIDLYRIKHPSELSSLKLREVFSVPNHLVLIEWPERAPKLIPKGAMRIHFHHGAKENERRIEIGKLHGKKR